MLNDDQLTVGVVGNGVMGSAIADRLLKCKHTVHVFDTDLAKMTALVAKGAIAAVTSAELAERCDTVIISLNTAAIVAAAVFGEQGVGTAATPNTLIIDMSSIDPAATVVLAKRLSTQYGASWVDSPLSGGAPAVQNGALTVLLGGEEAAVARARRVLQHLAKNITHMGGNGAGQTTKLINQVLCAANFLAVAEATRLAVDGGVDAERIPGALAGGRADSNIMQEFMAKMARRDYSPTGRIDNMLKDLESAQAFAMATRTPMPLTGLITNLHRMMVAAGMGGEDSAAYMKLFDFGRGWSTEKPNDHPKKTAPA